MNFCEVKFSLVGGILGGYTGITRIWVLVGTLVRCCTLTAYIKIYQLQCVRFVKYSCLNLPTHNYKCKKWNKKNTYGVGSTRAPNIGWRSPPLLQLTNKVWGKTFPTWFRVCLYNISLFRNIQIYWKVARRRHVTLGVGLGFERNFKVLQRFIWMKLGVSFAYLFTLSLQHTDALSLSNSQQHRGAGGIQSRRWLSPSSMRKISPD